MAIWGDVSGVRVGFSPPTSQRSRSHRIRGCEGMGEAGQELQGENRTLSCESREGDLPSRLKLGPVNGGGV